MKKMLFQKMAERMMKKTDSNHLERCVLCHKVVPVRRDEPVSERQFYIEGAGQLCEDCYQSIHWEEG